MVVTIQVPQELGRASITGSLEATAGLGDASLGSASGAALSAAERADILRSHVNGKLVAAALGVNFTVSMNPEALTIEKQIEADCARGFCKTPSLRTPHSCLLHLHLPLSRGRV